MNSVFILEGAVLLDNNDTNSEGVFTVYYGNEYVGVCADRWSYVETLVVCNQLGYYDGDVIRRGLSRFTYDSTLVVSCNGDETRISQCDLDNSIRFCNYDGIYIRCYLPREF